MDRIINKAVWPRREIFDFFSGISNPFYAVTFRQDVTELRNYCKERKISFYYGLIYLCCKALQDVPAFACRTRGENVVELGEQKPSFTDLKKGSELFHIVTMPCDGSIVEFCGKAREVSSKQDYFIDMAGQAEDLATVVPPAPPCRSSAGCMATRTAQAAAGAANSSRRVGYSPSASFCQSAGPVTGRR